MYKIKGVKKLAGYSKSLRGKYGSRYLQIFYDCQKKEVFAEEFSDFGGSWHWEPKNPDYVYIGFIDHPLTMVDIYQLIEKKLGGAKYV